MAAVGGDRLDTFPRVREMAAAGEAVSTPLRSRRGPVGATPYCPPEVTTGSSRFTLQRTALRPITPRHMTRQPITCLQISQPPPGP